MEEIILYAVSPEETIGVNKFLVWAEVEQKAFQDI